ncbi:Protein spinster 3 [Aphanomyces cochlioides]|nr:Protein spinster 3 [Aphanomyces cochlioides]
MLIYDVRHVFFLLCTINVLVYVTRGIIPGAPVQFQAFIQDSLRVDPANVSFYIGVLTTSFVAAYCTFTSVFGYLSMAHRPFRLAGLCLFIWIGSMVLSGVAQSLDNFYVLLVGRMLGGIGESAFQAVVPSFIDEFAPLEKRTLWMGLFGCSLSAGIALGFAYGSFLAQTIGWEFAFYIAAIIMTPLAYLVFACIPDVYNMPMAQMRDTAQSVGALSLNPEPIKTSLLVDTWGIVKSPMFITATLGWSACSFSISGMSTFGPAILIGLSVLPERICSTVFGALVVVAGLIGAPFGGYLVDYQCRDRENDSAYRQYIVNRQMFVMSMCGVVLFFTSNLVINTSWALLLIWFVALGLLFATTSPVTVAVLQSVTKARRGFAMGLSTLLLHIFGDLPAPIVLGALKDMWAPHCGSSVINGRVTLNPECQLLDHDGLKWVLIFAYAWLGLAVVFWFASFALARRQLQHMSKLYIDFERSSTPIVL